MSSLLNLEPRVSHLITHLSPPAVFADPATKRLLPSYCTEHFRRSFGAGSHQTSDCTELPTPLAPASASRERAKAGC